MRTPNPQYLPYPVPILDEDPDDVIQELLEVEDGLEIGDHYPTSEYPFEDISGYLHN
jgi:hypothetical protein